MIKLKIKVKSTTNETYSNEESLSDDYFLSRQNPEFIALIKKNIEKSAFSDIDSVKVSANLGEF